MGTVVESPGSIVWRFVGPSSSISAPNGLGRTVGDHDHIGASPIDRDGSGQQKHTHPQCQQSESGTGG